MEPAAIPALILVLGGLLIASMFLQSWLERLGLRPLVAFLARGWDVGSGPTEAFCKTLTRRLKGSGMRWNTPNAEAMMALGTLTHSNPWKRYRTQQRQAA